MTSRRTTLERARLSKTMRLSGLPLGAVAERLDCSVRTARRLSRMDLSEDYEDSLEDFGASGANAEEKTLFLTKGWPLLLSMVDTLEARVASDTITTRDLTTAISVLSDRLIRFSPPVTTSTETRTVELHFFSDKEYPNGLDGQRVLPEPAEGEKDFIDAPEDERALESPQEALEGDGEG